MNDFKRIIATILIVSLILNVNGILTLAQNLNNETSNTLETTETKIIEQLKNDLGETHASQILLNSENENLNNSENVIVDSEVEPGEDLDEINNENENIDEPEEDEGDNKSFSEEDENDEIIQGENLDSVLDGENSLNDNNLDDTTESSDTNELSIIVETNDLNPSDENCSESSDLNYENTIINNEIIASESNLEKVIYDNETIDDFYEEEIFATYSEIKISSLSELGAIETNIKANQLFGTGEPWMYWYLTDGGHTIHYTNSEPASDGHAINDTIEYAGIIKKNITNAIFDNNILANSCIAMFSGFANLTNIENLSYLNTSNVSDMTDMFSDCKSLTNIDLSNFDVSNVISMRFMFYNCSNLTSIDLSSFNTQSITDTAYMFDSCTQLENIVFSSNFNTSNVTDMDAMFWYCENLTSIDLSSFDVSNVINMEKMFQGCKNITTINLSGFNTDNVLYMGSFFSECYNLTNIIGLEGFNTSSVIDMSAMFSDCENLSTLNLNKFNTENVVDFRSMFYNCKLLESLNISSFNVSNSNNYFGMIKSCISLNNITISESVSSIINDLGLEYDWKKNGESTNYYYDNASNKTTIPSMAGNYLKVTDNDNRVTVIFDSRGGSYVHSQTVDINTTINEPDNPYKSNNTFLGWYDQSLSNLFDFNSNISDNMVLYAKWEELTPINIYWYIENNNELHLSSIEPANINYNDGQCFNSITIENSPWNQYNEDITKVVIDNELEPTSTSCWFNNLTNLIQIDNITNLNTTNVQNMYSMFYNCSSLTELDLSNFDTSNVTSISQMFSGCSSLTTININSFNTENVKNMSNLFYKCKNLSNINLSSFNTEKVTFMQNMFNNCNSLTSLDISNFNTEKVTNMVKMFSNCINLESINLLNFNTSSVTNFSGMFEGCKSLENIDVSSFDTSKCVNMQRMFMCSVRNNNQYDSALTSIVGLNNFDTSHVNEMNNMFTGCNSLTTIDLSSFDTRHVVNMSQMFRNCSSLTTIYSNENFVVTKVIDGEDLFYNCTNLIGGNGTNYTSTHIDKEYARIDTEITPGYFTNLNVEVPTTPTISSISIITFPTKLTYNSNETFDPNGLSIIVYYSDNTNETIIYNNSENNFSFNPSLNTELKSTYSNVVMTYSGKTKNINITVLENTTPVEPNEPWMYWYLTDNNKTIHYSKSYKEGAYPINGNDSIEYESIARGATCAVFDNMINAKTCKGMFDSFLVLKNIENMQYLNTSEVTNMSRMFYACYSLTGVNLNYINTTNVTNMEYMFFGCWEITNLDLTKFDTSNVTNMSCMFSMCKKIKNINIDLNNFKTSNVTTMSGMFSVCYDLISIDTSNFNTSNVTDMSFMFDRCLNLANINLSNFNTTNVTNMSGMFIGCSSLTSLDVSKFDTTNVTDMSFMFYTYEDGSSSPNGEQESNLKEIIGLDCFNTSNVTDMSLMFYHNNKLETIDLTSFNTLNVADSSRMFSDCSELVTIYVSNEFVLNNVPINTEMFNNCNSIIGGNGTTYSSNHISKEYARIDTTGNPGYFTLINYNTGGEPHTFSSTDYILNRVWYSQPINNIRYYDITKIKFIQSDSQPSGTQFIVGKNGTETEDFYGYLDGTEVTICFPTTGTLYAPESSIKLFYYFANLYEIENLNLLNTTYVKNMKEMFSCCSLNLTSLDLSSFNTINVENMEGMFYGCRKLQSLDLSSFNTSNVTNMKEMFNGLCEIIQLDLSSFNTQNVTTMYAMFAGCEKLENLNISSFNTHSVETFEHMFTRCEKIVNLDLSHFNTSNAKYMSYMFWRCFGLEELNVSNFNTSRVIKMDRMFRECKKIINLDLSSFNTSNCIWMCEMFSECRNLKYLNISNFDTRNTYSMGFMFDKCSSIIELDISSFNTQRMGHVFGWNMDSMFGDCSELTTIYASEEFQIPVDNDGSLLIVTCMFSGCGKLIGGNGFKYDGSVYRNPKYQTHIGPYIDGSHYDMFYAHIDTPENPGYFTYKHSSSSYSYNSSEPNIDAATISNISIVTNPSKIQYNEGETFEPIGLLINIEYSDNTNEIATYNEITKNNFSFSPSLYTELNTSNTNVIVYYGGKSANIPITVIEDSNNQTWMWWYLTDNGRTIHYTNSYAVGGHSIKSVDRIEYEGLLKNDITKAVFDNQINAKACANMFLWFENLTTIENLTLLNTSDVTNMSAMFCMCRSLTSIDLNNFNTENVVNMSQMFQNCESVINLNVSSFNTSNVTDMSGMFCDCNNLINIDVSDFDTSNVTNMHAMFYGLNKITNLDLRNFNTENVNNMCFMLSSCWSLTDLNLSSFDTSNVTDMRLMFRYCPALTNLDLSNFNTENVTDMFAMFSECTNLTYLNISTFNTTSVNSMIQMFFACRSLTTIDLSNFNTNNLTRMDEMFKNCSSLITIYANDNFITTNVIETNISANFNSQDVFLGCYSLVGGNGTTYNNNFKNKNYAKVDTVSNPGYFTFRAPTNETEITYNIAFDLCGINATTPSNIIKTKNIDTTLYVPTSIPTGYSFVAWYKEPEYNNIYNGVGDLTEENGITVTLYAKWHYNNSFDVTKHAWGFDNYITNIPREHYLRVLGKTLTYELMGNATSQISNGVCYGMAGLVKDFFDNNNYNLTYPNNNYLNSVNVGDNVKNIKDSNNNERFTSNDIIQMAFLYQFTKSSKIFRSNKLNLSNDENRNINNKLNINQIIDSLQNGNICTVVIYNIGTNYLDETWGHALVAYDYSDSEIKVYDCNYPNDSNCKITYVQNVNGNYDWQYTKMNNVAYIESEPQNNMLKDIILIGDQISYNELVDFAHNNLNTINNNDELIINTTNKKLKLNYNNNEIELTNNSPYYYLNVGVKVDNDGNVIIPENNNYLYILPKEDYQIENMNTNENLDIRITANNELLEIKSNDLDKAEIKFNNNSENEIILIGDENDVYSITYLYNNNEISFEQLHIDGQLTSTVSETKYVNDGLVLNNTKLSAINGILTNGATNSINVPNNLSDTSFIVKGISNNNGLGQILLNNNNNEQILTSAETYEITYDANGGEVYPTSITKTKNQNISLNDLATPTRDGYEFLGWYRRNGGGTEYVTKYMGNDTVFAAGLPYKIQAKWKPNNYKIIYNTVINDVEIASTSVLKTYGEDITLLTPTKASYSFVSWHKNYEDAEHQYGDEYNIGNDDLYNQDDFDANTNNYGVNIYAKWRAMISFELNSHGTLPDEYNISNNVDLFSTYDLPYLTETGYTFNGWFDNAAYEGYPIGMTYSVVEPKTFYAKWTPNEYYIHLNLMGVENATIEYDTYHDNKPSLIKTFGVPCVIATPSGFENENYIFDGWFTDQDYSDEHKYDSKIDYSYGGTSVELYAKWKLKISFNANGHGSNPEPIFVVKDLNQPISLPTLNDIFGYRFNGWWTNPDGTGIYYNPDSTNPCYISAPITLYAKWVGIQYYITYDTNDCYLPTGTDVTFTKTFGTPLTEQLATPIREGYNFVGWQRRAGNNYVPYNQNTDAIYIGQVSYTIYAKWEPISYTIHYNTVINDAYIANNYTYKTYDSPITLSNPTKTDYKFVGWYENFNQDEKVYTNPYYGLTDFYSTDGGMTDIYAKWQAKITYNLMEHGSLPTGVTSPSYKDLYYDTQLPHLDDVTGWTFSGWYENEACTGNNVLSSYTVNEPKILYAKWEENEYKIILHINNGTFADGYNEYTLNSTTSNYEKNRLYTESVTLPTSKNISKVGYTFDGWYLDPSFNSNKYSKVDANSLEKVFYAKWIENTYEINYFENGGIYAENYSKHTGRKYSESKLLPIAGQISKVGYDFAGWYENSDFTGSAITSIGPNVSVPKVVYAKWNEKTYNITYFDSDEATPITVYVTDNAAHWGDGFTNIPISRRYTEAVSLPGEHNIVKRNNFFLGWYKQGDTNQTTITSIPANKAEDYVLIAKWDSAYEVTFNYVVAGIDNEIDLIRNGYQVGKPNDPTYTNERFVGWYRNNDDTLTTLDEANSYAWNFNTAVTESFTLYAKWEDATTYEVQFNLTSGAVHPNDGDITGTPANQYVVSESNATNPSVPVSNGYSFKGWYLDPDFTEQWDFDSFTINSNTTIYGKWELINYTITYNTNNGVWADGYTKPESWNWTTVNNTNLPTSDYITRAHYTFNGWYKDSNFTDQVTGLNGITTNLILYAKWNLDESSGTYHTINFLPGGGSGTMSTQYAFDGEQITLNPNTFTKSGFSFNKWISNDGSTFINGQQNITVSENLILTAEWKANSPNNPYRPTPYYPSGGGYSGGGSGGGGGRAASALTNNALKTPTNETNTNQITTLKLNVTKSIKNYLDSDKTNWVKDTATGNWKLETSHGTYATGGFYLMNNMVKLDGDITKISTDTYFFNSQGNMVTGWVQTSDNKWFFFENAKNGNEGKMALGWKKVDDKYYFFTKDGSMLVNDLTPDGFIVGADGAYIN